MMKRYVTIKFSYLQTDWYTRHQPSYKDVPLVIARPVHGRMVIQAVNPVAHKLGIIIGTVVADARAIVSSLQVIDDKAGLTEKLLTGLAAWCIRFTPVVAIDPVYGLILDCTGCPHLWGDDTTYLTNIIKRLKETGYHVRASMADTIGAAWAMTNTGYSMVVPAGEHYKAILPLPSSSLRLDTAIVERLYKLGLRTIGSFIAMPASALRRRFGQELITRLQQAMGHEEELIIPVQTTSPYVERLPCIEPIVTAGGIEIALKRLLESMHVRLKAEQKGIRMALFRGYRVDGKIVSIEIGTNRATYNTSHLFKLFENKISTIEPALGIELFTLEAKKTEDVCSLQHKLWETTTGLASIELTNLLDRIAGKFGTHPIKRYIPDEHYWPERSFKPVVGLDEKTTTSWNIGRPRPILLINPERIEVTAPIPDYPPMLFRYKGKLHTIAKADGPERIEQEWWLQQGEHRDYYYVEDKEGKRYWLFRLGHYTGDKSYQWFLHGFFA